MTKSSYVRLAAGFLFVASGSAFASDIEGKVESVNKDAQSLVVQGIEFHTTDTTDYDDGITSFEELSEGQQVEVDFEYRDGQHYVVEVELDD